MYQIDGVWLVIIFCYKTEWHDVYSILFYSIPGLYSLLPQDLVKSRSREIRIVSSPIALKFDRHLGSTAIEMPVIFQSNTIIITSKSHDFETSRDFAVRRVTA